MTEAKFSTLKPEDYYILFHRKDKNGNKISVGKLYLKGDNLAFEGSAEESAKIFFDYLIYFCADPTRLNEVSDDN